MLGEIHALYVKIDGINCQLWIYDGFTAWRVSWWTKFLFQRPNPWECLIWSKLAPWRTWRISGLTSPRFILAHSCQVWKLVCSNCWGPISRSISRLVATCCCRFHAVEIRSLLEAFDYAYPWIFIALTQNCGCGPMLLLSIPARLSFSCS